MYVTRISWVGVDASDFEQTVLFFEKALSLTPNHRDDLGQVARFRLNSGDVFEIVGPYSDHLKEQRGTICAFEVEDIVEARREMENRGVAFITAIETWEEESWCYFRGPDGYLYAIRESRCRRTG